MSKIPQLVNVQARYQTQVWLTPKLTLIITAFQLQHGRATERRQLRKTRYIGERRKRKVRVWQTPSKTMSPVKSQRGAERGRGRINRVFVTEAKAGGSFQPNVKTNLEVNPKCLM